MNTVFNTYKATFQVLGDTLTNDIIQGANNGTFTIDEEDLKKLVHLISTTTQNQAINGWEALQRTIATTDETNKKTTKSRTKRTGK